MNNLKTEFIRAIMISLKLEDNPFIIGTVDDYIKDIEQSKYKLFMSELFGTQHAYLNGLDRVAKVAEKFKPIAKDEITDRAKRLIQFTETQNTNLRELAEAQGTDFNQLVMDIIPKDKYKRSFEVMDLVKPYYDAKQLIINIRLYQTSIDTLNAFKQAITKHDNGEVNLMIASPKKKLIIPDKVYYDDEPREYRNAI